MSEIIAKLKNERTTKAGSFIQVFEVGCYLVIVERWQSGSTYASICNDSDNRRYLPHLYVNDDLAGGFRSADISVETTSYGSLPPAEIKSFMADMQEGVDTAKYISEKFIRPMMYGIWNGKVTK